jgi:transposase
MVGRSTRRIRPIRAGHCDGRVRRLQDRGHPSHPGCGHGDGSLPRGRPGRAKLDLIRQRIQQQTLGRRGHTGDPLYGIRRIARTRLQLLSPRQYARLNSVFDTDEHLAVKVAWLIYQKIIAAYADPNRRRGKQAMTRLIESIRRGVPAGLTEIAQLGRTLARRRNDILAFFDHHASNGPTEAINGRLEALRRNPLGFRNLTHYRWRSLLHSGALHQLVNAL